MNFRANGASITYLEQLHYYPFGMLMEGLGTVSPTNDYAYNGKELNEDFGLNLSNYGARWYDAAVGRWWNVDPMGEKTISASTYAYVVNNPLVLIDLFGLSPQGARETAQDVERWDDYYRAREIEKEEHEKSKKEKQNNSLKLPTMYIANVAQMNVDDLGLALGYAGDILSENGINGIRYLFVSVEEAKKHSRTYEFQGFLAIVNQPERKDGTTNSLDFYGDPGVSQILNDGTIGVYYDGNNRWASFVNIGVSEISNHNNPTFAIGYIIAHESLHQLLGIASFYRQDGKVWGHVDGQDNLNKNGHNVSIPSGPSSKLRAAERILPYQLAYLLSFYDQKNK